MISAGVLLVFAAASLSESFAEIGKAFEAAHPEATVEFNFAGSRLLQMQIERGAPADVFAPADRSHAEALEGRRLLEPSRIFARNHLVVVTPRNGRAVQGLDDLARHGTRIVAADSTVPIGRYTLQTLRKAASVESRGDDYERRVRANLVSREANARAVLAKVVLGEADAAFVYATDAATVADKIEILQIPDSCNVVAEYPIGVVAESANPALSREFVAFVLGPEGWAILERYGFAR